MGERLGYNPEQLVNKETGVTLEELGKAFQLSFSSNILANPEGWRPEYPSFGHCSAAAQVTNDLFGGDIQGYWFGDLAQQWGVYVRGSHYLNVLPDGQRVDFTRSQFPPDFPYESVMIPHLGKVVDREKEFGNAGSAGQYARLHIAVTRNLWSEFNKKIPCKFLDKSKLPWEISQD